MSVAYPDTIDLYRPVQKETVCACSSSKPWCSFQTGWCYESEAMAQAQPITAHNPFAACNRDPQCPDHYKCTRCSQDFDPPIEDGDAITGEGPGDAGPVVEGYNPTRPPVTGERVAVAMTSEHQCCFAIWALSDPAWNPLGWQSYVGNPIVAWQYDAVARACSYHRQRVLQTPSLYGRSAEWVASQKCSATPLTTYLRPSASGARASPRRSPTCRKPRAWAGGTAAMPTWALLGTIRRRRRSRAAPRFPRDSTEQWTSALGEASEVYEYVAPVISGGSSVVKFADYNHGARIDYDPAACCAACSANAD